MNCRQGIWTNFPTRRPVSQHLRRTASRDWFLPTYDNVLCTLVFSSGPAVPRSPRPAANPLRSNTHGRYNFTSLRLESPVT